MAMLLLLKIDISVMILQQELNCIETQFRQTLEKIETKNNYEKINTNNIDNDNCCKSICTDT